MRTEPYIQTIRYHFPGMNVQECNAVFRVLIDLVVYDNDINGTDYDAIMGVCAKYIEEKLDEMERDMK